MKTPALLAPAGSYDALVAALASGADEVYFGGGAHNARIGAANFGEEEFAEAIKLCRLYGVKSNITLNTLVFDRELDDALQFAYRALSNGGDAFIVQDLGLAKALRERFPDITLHASTQCACHNSDGAKLLSDLGFSRIVLARELPMCEIESIIKDGIGRYETELFLHGALCVSHSGMCLMSSCIGKRSGNRGLCAQPCRLPYTMEGGTTGALLSLKDLSLANHMTDLVSLGTAALKIEGRMKSPEYVAGVTSVYRRLLDENRNATADEMRFLRDLFSRNGFTNGYFNGSVRRNNTTMYGVRSDAEKRVSAEQEKSIRYELPKLPIQMECEITLNKPVKLTAASGNTKIEIESSFLPVPSLNAPLTEKDAARNLQKLGSSPFRLAEGALVLHLDNNLFLTSAQLNELRRNAVEKLTEELKRVPSVSVIEQPLKCIGAQKQQREASYRLYFQSIHVIDASFNSYHPIESVAFRLDAFIRFYEKEKAVLDNLKVPFGVMLPEVVFNEETDEVLRLLQLAKKNGAVYAEASNIGHITLCQRVGLTVYGGMGLNLTNSESIKVFEKMGLSSLTLSPELNTAQMRDMEKGGATIAVVSHGRLPLMVLESCIRKAAGKCSECDKEPYLLTDRMKYRFPVASRERLSGEPHACRNVIYNAVELDLLKNKEKLQETGAAVYGIFESI